MLLRQFECHHNRRRRHRPLGLTVFFVGLICIVIPSFVGSFALLPTSTPSTSTTTTTTTTFHYSQKSNIGNHPHHNHNQQPAVALPSSSKTSRRLLSKQHHHSFCFYLKSQKNDDNDTTTTPANSSNNDDHDTKNTTNNNPNIGGDIQEHVKNHDHNTQNDDIGDNERGGDDDNVIRLRLDMSKLCQIVAMSMENRLESSRRTTTAISILEPLIKAIQGELMSISWEDEIAAESSSTSTTTTSPFGSTAVPDCVPEKLQEYRRFCSYFESDICHDGRFTVFGTTTASTDGSTTISSSSSKEATRKTVADNDTSTIKNDGNRIGEKSFRGTASLHPDVLFALDDPLLYLRDVLSCPSDPRYTTSRETVVVLPGPNAPHQPTRTSSSSSPEMVEYYSKVLGGIGLAQLHCGSQLGHGDIVLSDRSVVAELEGFLMEHGLLEHDSEIFGGTKSIVLNAADRDFLRLFCHYYYHYYYSSKSDNGMDSDDTVRHDTEDFTAKPSLADAKGNKDNNNNNNKDTFEDSRAQRSILKLVDAAVNAVSQHQIRSELSDTDEDDNEDIPHLVLLAHSGSTIQVAQAIRDWKMLRSRSSSSSDTTTTQRAMSSDEELERLLRQAVTVVTIGSVCQDFPDGPAYVHLSFTDDPFASTFGFGQQQQQQKPGDNTASGGKDAIHVRTYSPYLAATDDGNGQFTIQAHNMGACGIQCLALLLRVNGTRSFRKLFELASTEICSDIPNKLFAVASQASEMHVPPNLEDELLPAMIRATKGDQWLWRRGGKEEDPLEYDDDDEIDDMLLGEEESRAILEWQFGYDAYDDIVGACSERMQYDECQLLD